MESFWGDLSILQSLAGESSYGHDGKCLQDINFDFILSIHGLLTNL